MLNSCLLEERLFFRESVVILLEGTSRVIYTGPVDDGAVFSGI